ncbi:hypothetical protein F5146DRAFT_323621 [Armillaria mellea]|nr:hypothetical protein F5146DRAFT_323621 [Armillaria mellea]
MYASEIPFSSMVAIPSSPCSQLSRKRKDSSFLNLTTRSCIPYGSETTSSLVSPSTSAKTSSYLSTKPSSSSTPTPIPTRSSTHTGVIVGSVVGGVTFMCTLFLLAIFFTRRGYFIRKNSDRKLQIPDPFHQGKVRDSNDPILSLGTPAPDMPPDTEDHHDRVQVRDDRERLEHLESTVQLLLSEWQRCNDSGIHEPPPDYISSTVDVD